MELLLGNPLLLKNNLYVLATVMIMAKDFHQVSPHKNLFSPEIRESDRVMEIAMHVEKLISVAVMQALL